MLALLASTALIMQPAATPDWVAIGEQTLAANKAKTPIDRPAKNVILMVADGMDITTITAGRIYAGQKAGGSGEENILALESLPHVALAKTYNTDMQVPDSAGTATAMLSGHKTRAGVINIDQSVVRGDCAGSQGKALPTFMNVAAETGRAIGIISTARITHATPAAVYAHSPSRNWEADTDLPEDAAGCTDIAQQLIEAAKTNPIKLVLGGGRRNFLPATAPDPEYPDRKGARGDDKDLTAQWADTSRRHKFVWDKDGFDKLRTRGGQIILGLFEPSHMNYEADRAGDTGGEPSLAEMTSFAIDRLSRERDGYFLLVEGGRVDHAHHGGNAARALEDLAAFDAAVATVLEKTDPQETLVIVTADHGHTMAIQGYPRRGNPILGLVRVPARDGEAEEGTLLPAADGKPYTTLAYTNGPGSPFAGPTPEGGFERAFVTDEEAQSLDYRQPSIIPGGSETHGGQDVSVHARGPQAHLINGVFEQNYIYYVMREAAQSGE